MSKESQVAADIIHLVADRLNAGRLSGLRWSPRMPDDDPDAEFIVVDENGVEYELDIEVFLHQRSK